MMAGLRDIDRTKFSGVHPDLMRVIENAAKKVEMRALEGVRSDEQAYINWGKGRTAAQLAAKGIPVKYAQPNAGKVTWLSNPLNTKHRKQADGFGHAADVWPAPYSWTDLAAFDRMAAAMFTAAREENVSIRWGADWDGDGKPRERGEADSPHFELGRAATVIPVVTPVLRKGSKGGFVAILQHALNAALGLALKEDGGFGDLTEAAVRDFQTKHGLTADGIVGALTRKALGL